MRAIRIINLFGFVLFLATGIAQQLSPTVVATSGGFYSNDEGMLSFTIGEMSAVETFSNQYNILTQGFQQNWELGTAVEEHPKSKFSFGIYPNPSYGLFNLVTETAQHVHVEINVFNVLGVKIHTAEYYHQKQVNIESFNLSSAGQGMYIVAITVKADKQSPGNLLYQKINVIF